MYGSYRPTSSRLVSTMRRLAYGPEGPAAAPPSPSSSPAALPEAPLPPLPAFAGDIVSPPLLSPIKRAGLRTHQVPTA